MSKFTALDMSKLSDADKVAMVKTHLKGKPLYVRFTDRNAMREGSIGIIKEYKVEKALTKNGVKLQNNFYHSRWHSPNIHKFKIGPDK